MGKLIVIEGSCDSVGKSTQYKLLVDYLMSNKYKVIQHHFPSYGTYQGRAVEEYLKGNYGNISELSPYFVNSLYAQDRAITWETGLKEEYKNGGIIVLDRYTTSSLIYQSTSINDTSLRDNFIEFVNDYEYNKLNLPKPDLVIFLHVPFELARSLKEKRKKNSGVKDDIHERDLEFMKKVSDTSIYIAKKNKWDFIECSNGEDMLSIEEIHKKIRNLVMKKIGSK